jgi:hypothetical protein
MFENIRSDPFIHFGLGTKTLSQTHVIITVDLTKDLDTEVNESSVHHQPLCRIEAAGVFAEILCLPKGQNYILALAVNTFTANAGVMYSMEVTLHQMTSQCNFLGKLERKTTDTAYK